MGHTMSSFIPNGQSLAVVWLRHVLAIYPNGICKVTSCETVCNFQVLLVFFNDISILEMSVQPPVFIKLILT